MRTKIAVVADTHCPYQDDVAVELTCKIIKDFKPNLGVHLGDGCDFYAVSTFNKNPRRILEFQNELNATYMVNSKLAQACKKTNWTYLVGNHEVRWSRHVNKYPELFSLRELQLEKLLGLDKLGWELANDLQVENVLFTHGKRVSKHSGRAVMAEMMDRLYQLEVIVIGHNHRTGQYITSGCGNIIRGYEVGCLCNLRPDYRPVNNWSQSVLLMTLDDNIEAEQIIYQTSNGVKSTMWRGKKYSSEVGNDRLDRSSN